MSSPLHAAYFADQCVHGQARVLRRDDVAAETVKLTIECPDMAARILPGQFFMVRVSHCDDPLIGRPFALWDVVDGEGLGSAIQFVFLIAGKMTRRLARLAVGETVDVWGPLGNGFRPQPCRHLIMVAGGIGQTPFLAVAKERQLRQIYGGGTRKPQPVETLTLCYGARSANRFAGLSDFREAGVGLHLATDDGSAGHHGLVTDLLQELLSEDPAGSRVLCCGPHAMMKAVSKITAEAQIPCEVSLEEPMACGIGICFTCVAKIRDTAGTADYKRTCVEGPVFDAARVEW